MSEINRKNHPEFIKYQEFIVSQPNYKGLHFTRNKDDSIRWVVTGKSADGQKRKKWWIGKCKEYGIKVEAGAFAKAAVLVHPTKLHTCQICGKSLQIEYVYPNKRLLKKLDTIFQKSFESFEKDVFEIIDELNVETENFSKLCEIFKAPKSVDTIENLKSWIYENHTKTSSKSFLSPGVMSNPPDRFDGFHSDGNCCRSKSDKGRHKENLQRYAQDRRVYENWADGDWKMADRLMGEFRKHGVSPDHIGAISLGFCHRPKFHPMTVSANSAKNNRMSFDDVKTLIEDEKNGEQVVSWHSKYIWDSLKHRVKTDEDAVKLSFLMRTNLHYVLTVFSIIDENSFRDFLMQFLNLEYSFYDYKFKGFDAETGTYKEVVKTEKKGKNQDNNAKRYIRIAFESLQAYKNKENRKVGNWQNPAVNAEIDKLLEFLKAEKSVKAKEKLHEILRILAVKLTLEREKVTADG